MFYVPCLSVYVRELQDIYLQSISFSSWTFDIVQLDFEIDCKKVCCIHQKYDTLDFPRFHWSMTVSR